MFSPSQIATPYLTNGDEAVKFSMTIENIKVFASTQKPACFRVRRSEFQCLGRHECRLQVRSPDASTLEAMVDYGVPLDPSTSIDCVLTIIRLKSQTGMPDIVLKMLHGTRKIGVLQDILDPVNGYTKDNALHLDVEMSIFEPKPMNRISLKIPRVKEWLSSQGTQRIVSQPIHIGDAKWHMSVKPGRDENNASNIGVYIHCNPMADTCAEWMCVVSRTLVLKSHIRKKPNLVVTSENYLYTDDDNSWAAIDFVTEKDLLDPAKGYLTAGGSAEFYAYLTVAQPLTRKIDEYAGKIFSQFEPELEMNGSLSFSKRKLRVNKELLAAYSPFFEALFFTRRDDFKERDMQQIPLDEIRLEDFKVLLSVIYPKYGIITDTNVMILLELADRFQMKFVVKLCENHLMKKSKLSVKTKIEASDMFHLPNVMRKCLSGVRSAEPLLSLIEDRDFMCGLSKETQNKIRQEIVGNWARRN